MKTTVTALLRAYDDGRDRSEFYRGWRMGLHAGLTHSAVMEQMPVHGGSTRALRAHLLRGTRAGDSIESLLKRAAHLTEPFERAVLAMGEESGQLERVLAELAEFHFRQYKLILKVRKALAYPMFLSLVAAVIGPLPLVFAGRSSAYLAVAGGGVALWFTAGAVIFAGLAQRYQQRPEFVRARFARTLALTLASGLPLPRAVTLAAEATGNPTLVAHIRRHGEHALATQSLERTLEGSFVMTPEFTGMLRVAEQTGDFTTSIGKLAALYEDGFK